MKFVRVTTVVLKLKSPNSTVLPYLFNVKNSEGYFTVYVVLFKVVLPLKSFLTA